MHQGATGVGGRRWGRGVGRRMARGMEAPAVGAWDEGLWDTAEVGEAAWESGAPDGAAGRVRYACPGCRAELWAEADLEVVCLSCWLLFRSAGEV